jgi:hypothetical protein
MEHVSKECDNGTQITLIVIVIIKLSFVVCFFLCNLPASELYMPTFRNTLSLPSSLADSFEEWLCLRTVGVFVGEKVCFENGHFRAKPFPQWIRLHFSNLVILHNYGPMKTEQSVPKRLHIQFRRRGITQKKAYNIQNTAKVWKQQTFVCLLISGSQPPVGHGLLIHEVSRSHAMTHHIR